MEIGRADYEAAVQAIAAWAQEELGEGRSVEDVAREAVQRRNGLKQQFRAGVDPAILRLLELRNLRKYGDPIGPSPDALFERYGSWEGVISAASRHVLLGSS